MDIGAFERPATIGVAHGVHGERDDGHGCGSGNTGDLVYVIGQADANANLAGSIIEFDPTVFGTSQTITLSSTLELDEPSGPMMIEGPGASIGDDQRRQRGAGVSGGRRRGGDASGMTISGGRPGRLWWGDQNENFGTLKVLESTISGNAAGNGGGIASGRFAEHQGQHVLGNTAALPGGGLIVRGPTTISGSTFSSDMPAWQRRWDRELSGR